VTLQKIGSFFLTRILLGLAVVIGSVALAEWGKARVLQQVTLSYNTQNWIDTLMAVTFALCSYILLYRWWEKRTIIELSIASFPKNALAGLIAGLGMQALFILVMYATGHYSITRVHVLAVLVAAIPFALTAGVVAEILLVGILFRIVEEKAGTLIAMVCMVVLFVVAHWNVTGATTISLMATVVEAGLLIPSLYVLTRNLWAVIFMHFSWDLAEPGIFGGINPGMHTAQSLFSSQVTGPGWLSGGAMGPQNSLPALVLSCGASFIFLWLAWKKDKIVSPWWKPAKR